MKAIHVNASRNYPVLIGSGLLPTLGQYVKAQTVAVISDRNVWSFYGCALCDQLRAEDFRVVSYIFSAGEGNKNADTFLRILNFLAENGLKRSDCIVALGGGVVGDLAGFAAACYLRGIPYVQVPTSLLAMVDSSVGGKTAIDLQAGKNLAGAFYQPSLVLCDTDMLATLPPKVFRDGCAEIIKYGILYDEALFSHLEEKGPEFDPEAVISRCIELKRDVVALDEFDTGERRKLNLGHTFGHAIERASRYTVTHGQAVAIGMAMAARAACKAGICDTAHQQRILALTESFGLPVSTDISPAVLHVIACKDKKNTGGFVNVILPRSIGCCDIFPMDEGGLLELIKAGL